MENQNNKPKYDSSPSTEDLKKALLDAKGKISDLEITNIKLVDILIDNGLYDAPKISDMEAICINEIRKLKELSLKSGLTFEDTKVLDILHKNLLLTRNKNIKVSKKEKDLTTEELLEVINGTKTEFN